MRRKKLSNDEYNSISEKVRIGDFESVDTVDLELWIHKNLSSKEEMDKAKFELQKRQTYASIKAMEIAAKWQKWVAIGTILLAIATFILAYLTWVKL